MKIFVSGTAGFGSSTITELPGKVKEYLLDAMKQGNEFLVGDCSGIDYLVQKFLYESGYDKITVYASSDTARNCIGYWDVVHVPVPPNITGRDFYAQKDKAMQNDCDIAVALWDGSSRGTGANIENVKALGKPVHIWHLRKNCWL